MRNFTAPNWITMPGRGDMAMIGTAQRLVGWAGARSLTGHATGCRKEVCLRVALCGWRSVVGTGTTITFGFRDLMPLITAPTPAATAPAAENPANSVA